MPYREIIAVSSTIDKERKNIICEKNVEFSNLKRNDT
jgi:hypothetical protein